MWPVTFAPQEHQLTYKETATCAASPTHPYCGAALFIIFLAVEFGIWWYHWPPESFVQEVTELYDGAKRPMFARHLADRLRSRLHCMRRDLAAPGPVDPGLGRDDPRLVLPSWPSDLRSPALCGSPGEFYLRNRARPHGPMDAMNVLFGQTNSGFRMHTHHTPRPALSLALANTGPTAALKQSPNLIEGFSAEFVEVTPIIAAYRKMIRELSYDVCELAPTTYAIAKERGCPITALPIILMRRFHHNGVVKRPDSDIAGPKDLAGKRIGVRAYSVTTGVWTRGILQNEYGVDPQSVTWVVDDEDHVSDLVLPENVRRAPKGRSLAALFQAGEIDAAFTGNAGIGRAGSPADGWSSSAIADDTYPEVIADHVAASKAWFARTGVYPIHSLVVVRDELLARYPTLAQSISAAFTESKARYLEALDNDGVGDEVSRRYRSDKLIVGHDPLPFGLEPNRPAIKMLSLYMYQQGLTSHLFEPEDLFVDV